MIEQATAELEAGPATAPSHGKAHPSPRQYVLIAVILCAITGVEIATSYLEGVSNGVIVALLLFFAFVKFFMVASWFMHLRTDRPMFRRFFVLGAVGAIVLYTVVLLSLHVLIDV